MPKTPFLPLSLLLLAGLGCAGGPLEDAGASLEFVVTADEEAAIADLSSPPAEQGAADSMSATLPPEDVGLYGLLAVPHHDPRFHDHLEEARILVEEGRTGPAIDALRLALFDAPESALVWEMLGENYLVAGRPGRGVDCLEEALRHDGDLPVTRRILAARWLDRGDADRARPHAERLAVLQPEDPDAHYLLGRTYLGLAMWDEAISRNRRAISLDPQDVRPYNNLGFAALQRGRTELALQYLEAALELDGLEPHMLNNLGVAYERSGRPADAHSAYARAVDSDPSYSKARGNRDRVREIVDREVADEVARILAEQARSHNPPAATASRSLTP